MKILARKVGFGEGFELRPRNLVPAGFFAENGKYEFEISVDQKPLTDGMVVLLNEAPFEHVFRRGVSIVPYEMGFYSGELRVAILLGRKILAVIAVQVDPEVAKITRDEYAAMIAEISRSTLALYNLSGLTVPAEVEASSVRADIVTLDLVRSNISSLERAIGRIADQPVRRLGSTSRDVDVFRARKIDDRAISRALRSGRSREASARELRAAPKLVGALGGKWVSRIAEIQRTESTHLYENCALLGFLRWLDGTLRAIAQRIDRGRANLSAATAHAWAEQIRLWRSRLSALERRSVFGGLRPDYSLRASSIFRMHPDYAAAFAAMTRMKAGLGTGAAVAPSVPIDRTYALYELWCYVGILHAAVAAFPHSQEQVRSLLKSLASPNHLAPVLASGTSAMVYLSDSISLTYQRRFSAKPDGTGAHTLLIDAIPDISLVRQDSSGRCLGLVVMDPKYRSGASLIDGIRDLHVYRDAILGVDGSRLVAAAIAMAPRPAGEVTRPSHARPYAVQTRPGSSGDAFTAILNVALDALKS